MDPSSSTGDKPAVKNKRKRFVQPVLPALPQIPASKKKSAVNTQQSAPAVNGTSDEVLETSSRPISIQGTQILQNGIHKDGSPDAGVPATPAIDKGKPTIGTSASQDGRLQLNDAKPLLIIDPSCCTSRAFYRVWY